MIDYAETVVQRLSVTECFLAYAFGLLFVRQASHSEFIDKLCRVWLSNIAYGFRRSGVKVVKGKFVLHLQSMRVNVKGFTKSLY